MPLQQTEEVKHGEIKVTDSKATVLNIPNLASGIALILHDTASHLTGIAHIMLPDSALADYRQDEPPGKYADLAVVELTREYYEKGGNQQNTTVRMVGGSQLFNFGGGGGNLLNVGSRNAIAIRSAISKEGLAIDKAEVGGNKARNVRVIIATGQVVVSAVGDKAEYYI